MAMRIEYRKTHKISGTLEVKTGLRIGAGRDTIEIGGIDNPIVKHPHSQDPYIPGSSLKGKVRSLLEWALNKIETDGKVWGSQRNGNYPAGDEVLRIFGCTLDSWQEGPTRLIVRDAQLDETWRRDKITRGFPLTEEKSEVSIDRIKGKAAQMGPRVMERIPSGALFQFEMLFKEYSVDGDGGRRDRECLNRLLEGLKLLELDALGGSGSRGYGRVLFHQLQVNSVDVQSRFDAITRIDAASPNVVVEA
ncbi:MAG TPA: type III-A CRISPR-associated RAMP protein Csm3 [Paludibaculum sp.]|jgi:CRISPR-associated protein Csm3